MHKLQKNWTLLNSILELCPELRRLQKIRLYTDLWELFSPIDSRVSSLIRTAEVLRAVQRLLHTYRCICVCVCVCVCAERERGKERTSEKVKESEKATKKEQASEQASEQAREG